MTTPTEYKAKLRARKAAALGMTTAQFDAHCEAEARRIDDINRALTSRTHQWAVIASNAHVNNRSFTKLA